MLKECKVRERRVMLKDGGRCSQSARRTRNGGRIGVGREGEGEMGGRDGSGVPRRRWERSEGEGTSSEERLSSYMELFLVFLGIEKLLIADKNVLLLFLDADNRDGLGTVGTGVEG